MMSHNQGNKGYDLRNSGSKTARTPPKASTAPKPSLVSTMPDRPSDASSNARLSDTGLNATMQQTTGTVPKVPKPQQKPPNSDLLVEGDIGAQGPMKTALDSHIAQIVKATVGVNLADQLQSLSISLERKMSEVLTQSMTFATEKIKSDLQKEFRLSIGNAPEPIAASSHENSHRNQDVDLPDEFRTQFDNLVNSFQQNPTQQDPVSNGQFQFAQQFAPPTYQANTARDSSYCVMHKWNLKFDSKNMTVDEFIFRVEKLREAHGYSWEKVVTNFHQVVSGAAERWYWRFLQINRTVGWDQLRAALIEQYRSIETDFEISLAMATRKQSSNESFDQFYDDVMAMNAKLRMPKPIPEIVNIIRQNVRHSIAQLIFTYRSSSLPEIVYMCRNAEQFINQWNASRRSTNTPFRNVNELGAEESDTGLNEEEVEAVGNFRSSNNHYVRDTSRFKCWNCDQLGHGYMNCESTTRSLFCYKCGNKNVTTPNCPRCSENLKRNEITTGKSRSINPNPE